MGAKEVLSLSIDENTLVSINTPPNYIGNVEINVTPWMMTPISVNRFSIDEKHGRNKKEKTLRSTLSNIYGQTKTVRLMVRIFMGYII